MRGPSQNFDPKERSGAFGWCWLLVGVDVMVREGLKIERGKVDRD